MIHSHFDHFADFDCSSSPVLRTRNTRWRKSSPSSGSWIESSALSKVIVGASNSGFEWTLTDQGQRFSLSCEKNGDKNFIIGTRRGKLKLKLEAEVLKKNQKYGYNCQLFHNNNIEAYGMQVQNASSFLIRQIQEENQEKYIAKEGTKPMLTENIEIGLRFKFIKPPAVNEEEGFRVGHLQMIEQQQFQQANDQNKM